MNGKMGVDHVLSLIQQAISTFLTSNDTYSFNSSLCLPPLKILPFNSVASRLVCWTGFLVKLVFYSEFEGVIR